MTTIKEVAKLANVSVATVSRVINNSTKVSSEARIAVEKAQDELNYHPRISTKNIAKFDRETIGVIVADLSDPYFGNMIRVIDSIAHENSFNVITINAYHDPFKEKAAIETLIHYGCKCIIAHTLTIENELLARFMRDIPAMVLINRKLEKFEDRCIYPNDEMGSYLAVKHLINNGHREIAYMKSNHKINDTCARFLGYIRAIEEAKIPFNPKLIVEVDPTPQGGEDGVQMLLNSGVKFTAIATYNDMQAAGAMAILIDNDIKIPDNISVIGYDNMLISRYLQPRLTTILNPVTLMATAATNLTMAIHNQSTDTSSIQREFTPTLIKRFTVRDLRSFQ